MHVNPKIELTFASGLRAFLRQDPDVIMVGEIRDQETAEIAIHASLTGHLVLSTIHTNDAAGAVTRLVDMGVEPFLVRSSRDRRARAAPRARALPALPRGLPAQPTTSCAQLGLDARAPGVATVAAAVSLATWRTGSTYESARDRSSTGR